MVKRIFKRIFVFAVIACLLIACVPSVAFADVVEFQEAAKMGATIIDLYGSVNNTSLAYDALSDGSALTVIENLYQNYSTSASDPYTLAAIGAAAAAAGAIAVVYDAVTGKGYVQLYQEQYVSSLDGFWDYTLSDLGLLRNNDGFFEWTLDANDDVVPISVYEPYSPLPVLPSGLSAQQYYEASIPAYTVSSGNNLRYWRVGANVSSPAIYCVLVYNGYDTNQVFISRTLTYSGGRATYLNQSGSYSSTTYNVNMSHSNYYYGYGSQDGWPSSDRKLPAYSTLNAVFADFDTFFVSGFPAVVCEPEFYIGDPLTAQPTITIPDPASPQYVPSPSRINTGIEWLPEWGSPLPDGVEEPVPGVPYPVTDPAILNEAVPEIWSSVVSGTQTDPAPDPDPDPDPDPEPGTGPSEVYVPLLPVTLPNFNFSFSGIWHYVREWVTSLGAWFTTLFSIWNALPYAMVVPVYATAVVVIVLGVYKRFFM